MAARIPSAEPSRVLAEADPALGPIIDAIGPVELPAPRDHFTSLVRGIVGQQLSNAAAWSIFGRLEERGLLDPAALTAASDEDLRAAGLSRAKAGYVKGLAAAVLDGGLDLDRLDGLPDEDVILELTAVKGIGRWTAEMFLIFSLHRQDVLALDDLGVRGAVGKLLGLGRPATREETAEAGEKWRPYRSIASFYLWRAVAEKLLR